MKIKLMIRLMNTAVSIECIMKPKAPPNIQVKINENNPKSPPVDLGELLNIK